jgi:hypothetical protein
VNDQGHFVAKSQANLRKQLSTPKSGHWFWSLCHGKPDDSGRKSNGETKLRGLAVLRIFWSAESSMSTKQRVNGPKRRGQTVKAQSDAGLAEVARATSRLWRKQPQKRVSP